MDHYFMVLTSLSSIDSDNARVQELVSDVETYLTKTSSLGCDEIAKGSVQTYLAVLHTEDFETIHRGYSSCEWTLYPKNFCPDDDSAACTALPVQDAKLMHVKKDPLGDAIHQLCDKLPVLGTYLVDVICVTQKTEELPPLEERVELFGSLSRLVHWQRANLSLCCCSVRSARTSSWCDLLPFRIVTGPFDWDRLFGQNAVWRGGIQLLNHTLGGFHLRSAKNYGPSIARSGPHLTSGHFLYGRSELSSGDQRRLDGVMTVLSKIPLSSIPPHAVSSERLDLSLPCPVTSVLLENSSDFLSRVNSDEGMCFVLRLGIWTASVIANGNPMDTRAWKQKVLAGNFKAPDGLHRKEVGHRLFLLIGDGLCTKHSATMFPLRNTEDYNPKTCLRMALGDARSSINYAVESNRTSMDSFLKHIPGFSSQDLTRLRETILEKQIFGIQNLVGKMGNEVPAAYVLSIFKEITSGVISTFKTSVKAAKNNAVVCNGSSQDVKKSANLFHLDKTREPANWPERIFLKKKDIIHKYNDEIDHSLKPGEATFLKVDELLARLQSMENCKANICTATHSLDVFPPSSQFRPAWPEAAYGSFPDVYYCNDRIGEVKQQELNRLEARHVKYDTASLLESHSDGQERQVTPRLLPLIQSKSSQDARKITPKKRSAQPLPSTIQLRNAKDRKGVNSKSTKSEMSDTNLQKLRIAVVDALETHDIPPEHPLFKTCRMKLYTICLAFAKDVIGTGSTSKLFKEIAESHVQQVIQFETKRPSLNLRSKRLRTQ